MKSIIDFKDLNFAYDNKNAFNNFNMSIEENDIVTLIGPSGSGKTTLLKMLCHMLPNEYILYKQKEIGSYDIKVLRNEIVVIFDHPVMEKTPKEEIKRFIKKLGLLDREIDERYEELEKLFILSRFDDKETDKLSKEEEYLTKILRFLIIQPKFLAIDNLLGYLDKFSKDKMFSYIKKHKITLLNVSSNLDDALYGNKIFVIENFVLILEGSTTSVLKADTLLKRLGFRLPLSVNLSIELNNYDVLKKIYTDNDKLIGALWK